MSIIPLHCRIPRAVALSLAVLPLAAASSTNGDACSPTLIVSDSNTITAYRIPDDHVEWAVSSPTVNPALRVLVDGAGAIVLASTDAAGEEEVNAYDAQTGAYLWSLPGRLEDAHSDVHQQLYSSPLIYPCGPPRMHPSEAPSILVVEPSYSTSTTSLVNGRTGQVQWTRTDPGNAVGSYFIPAQVGSYDVVMRAVNGSGEMKRVDGSTGQSVLWTEPLFGRSGIPIPDITGDGRYDLATRANFSTQLIWLDGMTGGTLFSIDYGSFDVLGIDALPGTQPALVDVICAAQGSSAGGVRRYRSTDGSVVWDSSPTYNNQTLLGSLRRADGGAAVLSGWRFHQRIVALDASTGVALWDDVPLDPNLDQGSAAGATDVTGDGNEDLFSISGGALRLYDGATGTEVGWFAPVPATHVAVWTPCPNRVTNAPPACPGDLDGDDDTDVFDFAIFAPDFGCGTE